MTSADPTVSAARWLVAVTAGVIVALLVAGLIAQSVQHAIVERAEELVTNAMPSVKFLSAARGSLHDIERDLELDGANERERAPLQSRVSSARQDIEQQLAAYTSQPYFPHERELFAHVTAGLAKFDHDYAAWAASPTPATLGVVRDDLGVVDAALERVTTFDAEQGQRIGLEIESIRARSMGLVAVVAGTLFLFATGSVLLALRQLRRAARARAGTEAAREKRESELREQNEALGQFAGRVAHDILSPLATTMLSIDVLRQATQQDRSASRAAERGVAALDRVHVLVEGLLAFSRAGGKPDLDANAELAPVLGDLIDGLQAQAQQRGIVLSVPAVPSGSVACSPGVLTSIVTNLVQNAMKYMGEATERRVDVNVIDAGDKCRIEVNDTGPGIPEEQRRRIFEPYVQLGRAGGGIGLGLATVDRLVRAHGGTVGVRSEIGVGSTFWFELPRPRPITPSVDVSSTQPVHA